MKANLHYTYRVSIAVILLIALLLRLHYNLGQTFELPEHDQKNYTTMAVQLLDRGIYAYMSDQPNTLVTPGFPVFLALVFKTVGYSSIADAQQAMRILQSFMSLIFIWFLYLTGVRLFNRPAALLAALFAAIYGPFIIASSLILTETLFLCLLTSMVYYQVRIIQENKLRYHVIAGILLGLAVLTRPNTIILAATPYIFLWFQYRKPFLREIAVGAGAFCLAMLPWWLRNAFTFHELILISKGGAGNPFLAGTDPYNRGTLDMSKIDRNNQFSEGIKRVKEGLRTEPLLWIKWYTIGKMSTMYLDNIWWWPYPTTIPSWYASLLKAQHYFLTYAGFFFGVIGSIWSKGTRFLIIQCLLFLGIHLLFVAETRYTIGTFPFLMLIAAWAAVSLPGWVGILIGRRSRQTFR